MTPNNAFGRAKPPCSRRAGAPGDCAVSMLTLSHRILLIGLLSCTPLACTLTRAPEVPKKAQLLPFERINKRIRKAAELAPGDRMLSCNALVFMGRAYPPAGEPDPSAEVLLSDGPATYFDNFTGVEYARCDFWSCSRRGRYCETRCPPKRWTCEGIEEDPPANTSPEQASEK